MDQIQYYWVHFTTWMLQRLNQSAETVELNNKKFKLANMNNTDKNSAQTEEQIEQDVNFEVNR
jgi:hypothetical protein